jgi:hypothetical protein
MPLLTSAIPIPRSSKEWELLRPDSGNG